jgi:hypothetical protein
VPPELRGHRTGHRRRRLSPRSGFDDLFNLVAGRDSRGCRILPLRSPTDLTHPLLDRQQYSDLDNAREWLLTTLRRIDADGQAGWRDGGNPYPGLEPFTPALTGLFFGRASETRDLAATVRADNGHGVVAVTGPTTPN